MAYKDPEKQRTYYKVWYEEHKEEISVRRKKKRGTRTEYAREWRKKNRERYNNYHREYRAKQKEEK